MWLPGEDDYWWKISHWVTWTHIWRWLGALMWKQTINSKMMVYPEVKSAQGSSFLCAKIKRASISKAKIYFWRSINWCSFDFFVGEKWDSLSKIWFYCCCRWISQALHRWHPCHRWFQTWWHRRKRLPSRWKWKWLWSRIHPHSWWKWLFSWCGWSWCGDRWAGSHRKWPHHYRAEWVVILFHCYSSGYATCPTYWYVLTHF